MIITTATHLFTAQIFIFRSARASFAKKEIVHYLIWKILYLGYDQGTHNSFYFSEEILSQEHHKKLSQWPRPSFNSWLVWMATPLWPEFSTVNLNGDNIVHSWYRRPDRAGLHQTWKQPPKMGEKFIEYFCLRQVDIKISEWIHVHSDIFYCL